ncbi:hypothetical protein EH220_02525, partial [bacterium]
MKKFLSLAFLICCLAQAEAADLHGQILNSQNGVGIRDVELQLDNTNLQTSTDKRGRYAFDNIQPG